MTGHPPARAGEPQQQPADQQPGRGADQLPDPDRRPQAVAAEQAGPGLDRRRDRAVDAGRLGPRRLDRPGHRVGAAAPVGRRLDVRVATLAAIRPYAA